MVFAVGVDIGEDADASSAGSSLPTAPGIPSVSSGQAPAPVPGPVDTVVTVSGHAYGRPVPPGFLGVSIEYPALPDYTGTNPRAVNPVFEQLLRNLAPGQPPVVRIGGNSTDTTWWPAAGLPRPPGVSYALTPTWLGLAHSLARDIHGKLILGVDLEANRPRLAALEARALVAGVGRRFIAALEPGNEPLRYRLFPWYVAASPHRLVYSRPQTYTFGEYNRDFTRTARALAGGVPLAGPTFGGRAWMGDITRFLRDEPRIAIVTNHAYPLNRCWTQVGRPKYPTIPRLLSTYSSRADFASLGRYAALAHRRGLTFREDEVQSVACGGKRGVSDTFASALWALDSLFALARQGVDGVNLHTFPRAAYSLFAFTREHGRWIGQVSPEYYGLLMFARAAPAGALLLRISQRGASGVRAWSARGVDGTVRLVLINDDVRASHTVSVRQPVRGATATETALRASSVAARSGVTLGGASLAGTRTGRIGALRVIPVLRGARGGYRIVLPAGSAALVTFRAP